MEFTKDFLTESKVFPEQFACLQLYLSNPQFGEDSHLSGEYCVSGYIAYACNDN